MHHAATTSARGERIAPVPGEQPLTPEQLQLGFRHLARPGWPATLEEAMAQPARAAAIKGMARQLSRAAFGATQGRPASLPRSAAPVPPTPTSPPPRNQHGRDGKRAAANDLDD